MSGTVQQIAADAEAACLATAIGNFEGAIARLGKLDTDALTAALLKETEGRRLAMWFDDCTTFIAGLAERLVTRKEA